MQCFRRKSIFHVKKWVCVWARAKKMCQNVWKIIGTLFGISFGKNIAICQMENNFRTWMLQVINFSRKPIDYYIRTTYIRIPVGFLCVYCARCYIFYFTLQFQRWIIYLVKTEKGEKKSRRKEKRRKVIFLRRMWSKWNCIGSLDWFHPIKQ